MAANQYSDVSRTVDDFTVWLRDSGLGRYVQRFASADLDFDILDRITDKHLRELGVSLGDRERFWMAVEALEPRPVTVVENQVGVSAALEIDYLGESEEEELDIDLLSGPQGDTLRRFIEQGEEVGYITFQELDAALPPDQIPWEQFKDIVSILEEKDILISEDEIGSAEHIIKIYQAEVNTAVPHSEHKFNFSTELTSDRTATDHAVENRAETILVNLELVIPIAREFIDKGLPLLDLIQEGNIGLMRAVDKYDERGEYDFPTYATWRIRQAITRSIADQARTIRVPVHMTETIDKFARASGQMFYELQRYPTIKELAVELDLPLEKVLKVWRILREPIWRKVHISGEDDGSLGDFSEDLNAVDPAEAVTLKQLSETVARVLASLTPREERVLRMRFGIGMDEEHTLEEVGDRFSVTRERIRQIEAKALRKLKHPSRSEKLRNFVIY